MTTALTTNESINIFKEIFNDGMRRIQEACVVFVCAIDIDNKAYSKFRQAFKNIPVGAWSNFEKVGRKQMLPELLSDESPMGKKLKALPISLQKEAYGKPVKLLTNNGEVIDAEFHEIKIAQANQVMAKDHIRSIKEQKTYMGRAIERHVKKPKELWKITEGKLEVYERCDFTKGELKKMIKEL